MVNGQKSGPYAITQLRSMWSSGAITANSQYWCEGMAAWQPILQMRHMLEPAPAPHQASYPAYQAYHAGAPYPAYIRASKSRAAYIVLGLFFGCLGIHNFYAGRAGAGIAQLLITIFLGWLFIGIIITAFWALIEIIAVDTDGYGVRMT
ncbi:MAG TPA: GYF domain-containing protein [Pyrinomonadaceae bacterium]|nr:GYF domain-containing protein [Pyrinomonadaceae bacterium]